jgi:Ca2+-binding EF-hand superfamily protein
MILVNMWTITSQQHSFAGKRFKFDLIRYVMLFGWLGLVQSASVYAAQSGNDKANNAAANPAPLSAEPQSTTKDLSRADFIKLMDTEFRKRDADGNGQASRKEVEDFTKRNAITQAQDQNWALFRRLDVDGNGAVSSAEFTALISVPNFIDVAPEMARFDANRDQAISLVEYRTSTLANFDRMDADKDGILSALELANLNAPPPKLSGER